MRKTMLLGAVFGAGMLAYSCGGGSGGSAGSGGGSGGGAGSGTVSLYFTDDPGNNFPVVEVTIHEVNLCRDQACADKVNLFQDQVGMTIDLTNLNGVLQYVDMANVPEGNYPRLEIVMAQSANVCDNSGTCYDAIFTEMDKKPTKPNVVNCPPGFVGNSGQQLCYIRYNGTVNPAASGKLIVDFNLKEFEIDTTNWQITEVKVSPITPSGSSERHGKYEIYATVRSVDQNSFSANWMGATYTVNISNTTKCEVMDINYYGSDCLSQLQQGQCVEIKTPDDPATTDTLTAWEVGVKKGTKCGGKRQGEHESKREIKGTVSNIDQNNSSFVVDGVTIYVTDFTYCEYNEIHYSGSDCLTNLQEGWWVEVKVNQNNEALKIKLED